MCCRKQKAAASAEKKKIKEIKNRKMEETRAEKQKVRWRCLLRVVECVVFVRSARLALWHA